MARNYANIATAIWRDDDFKKLTVIGQHSYFMLATQPDITAAGVLPLTLGRWAARTSGASVDQLHAGLDELVRLRFVAVDEDTQELLIRSFVRHDGGYSNPKRRPVILRAARELESVELGGVLAVEFERLGLPVDDLLLPARSAVGPSTVTEPEPPSDSAFPQANRLSDRQPDAVSPSDGVVVTQAVVVDPQPTTLEPQPPPTATAVAVLEPAAEAGSDPESQGGSPSARSWEQTNQQPRTEGARVPRQPTPIVVSERESLEKIAEPLRTIVISLAKTDPDATREEASAIHQYIARQATEAGNPIKTPKYYTKIAESGGFSLPLANVRAQRLTAAGQASADAAAAVKAELQRLRDTEPECGHGTPAGASPHPKTGDPLCPQCRRGLAAPQSVEDINLSDSGRITEAYRIAWTEAGHEPIEITTMRTIESQARVSLNNGFDVAFLIRVAQAAAPHREDLFRTAHKLATEVAP